MSRHWMALFLLLTLIIMGCGGGTFTMMTNTMQSLPKLSGNLSFISGSGVTTTNTFIAGGPVQPDANGNITATLGISSIAPANCFLVGTTATFTGTVDSQGNITLTSAAINGQVVTLTTVVSADGNFFSKSTFTVTGGCDNGDHGSLLITHLATGAFTGTLTVNGNPVSVSLNINPPGLPQSDGSFPIVAGATFANNATCGFTSAGTEGGSQSGLAVGFTMVSNGVSTVTFGGTTIDSSGTTLNGSMSITGGGPCSGSSAAITLKKS